MDLSQRSNGEGIEARWVSRLSHYSKNLLYMKTMGRGFSILMESQEDLSSNDWINRLTASSPLQR